MWNTTRLDFHEQHVFCVNAPASADSGCGVTGHCVLGPLPLQMRIKSLNLSLSLWCLLENAHFLHKINAQRSTCPLFTAQNPPSSPVLFEFLLWMTKDLKKNYLFVFFHHKWHVSAPAAMQSEHCCWYEIIKERQSMWGQSHFSLLPHVKLLSFTPH